METTQTPSALASALSSQCPRCRRGPMFKYGPLNYAHFTKMHDACPLCGQTYHPEPGFYQIAMYGSYVFSIALLIVCFAGVYFLGGNPDMWVYITITVGLTLLLAPLNYRYSRIFMLYLFGGIKYDPAAANKHQ